jgi:hypothetical protein
MAVPTLLRSDSSLLEEGRVPCYARVRYEMVPLVAAVEFGNLVFGHLKGRSCAWFGSAARDDEWTCRGLLTVRMRGVGREAEWRQVLQLGLSSTCVSEIQIMFVGENSFERAHADEEDVMSFGGSLYGRPDGFGPRPHLRQGLVCPSG